MNSYNGFSPQQRLRALAWLKREYAAGRRVRPTACDACGQTVGMIEPHSEDYSEPFGDHIGAFGFCYRCHMMLHCRFSARAAWLAYLDAIKRGFRAVALLTRNFGQIRKQLSGSTPVYTPCAPPRRLVLEEIDQGKHRPATGEDAPTVDPDAVPARPQQFLTATRPVL